MQRMTRLHHCARWHASLERRVRENEEAVAAIDKFRQQLDRTISNLQGEVAALKAAQAGG